MIMMMMMMNFNKNYEVSFPWLAFKLNLININLQSLCTILISHHQYHR